MKEQNAVLIGAGRMGWAHAQALQELGLSISGVCDVRHEAVEAFRQEFSIPTAACYTNSVAFFNSIQAPDLVVIATTADTHCKLVCDAARAGASAIICEKPMAVSITECDAMLEACCTSGTRLAINHQMRFMDQYKVVKDVLDSGRLGRLASMNVVAGCFGLSMNGSHYVEAFHYLSGVWPVEVAGRFTGEPIANPRGAAFFDQAGDFSLVGDGGSRLKLSIGHDQGHGMTVTYAGATGHIFVDELQGEAIVTAREAEHRDAPATRYGMPWERSPVSFPQADNVKPTRAVIKALLDGEDYPDGEVGRQVVRAIVACYASAEQGGAPIALDDLGDAVDRNFPWA